MRKVYSLITNLQIILGKLVFTPAVTPGRSETVAIIRCSNTAAGNSVPPYIIFPCKRCRLSILLSYR